MGEHSFGNKSLDTLDQTMQKTSRFKIINSDNLNKAIYHITNLINDTSYLYKNESYATSAFLAITIIEEVAKTHTGLSIKYDKNTKIGKDPLRSHSIKHILGTNPTIKMGNRLNKAIGNTMIDKIIKDAEDNKLKKLRESSLYSEFTAESNNLQIPKNIVDKKLSRALLLFAIESFDDNLVGYTEYSMNISQKTDEIFEEISDDF